MWGIFRWFDGIVWVEYVLGVGFMGFLLVYYRLFFFIKGVVRILSVGGNLLLMNVEI